MTLAALESMFSDFPPDALRSNLNIPENYTTNPQAEVLILNSISPAYILSVNVNVKDEINDGNNIVELCRPYFGEFKFLHDQSLFTYRKDYEHWQRPPESFDNTDIDLSKLFEL